MVRLFSMILALVLIAPLVWADDVDPRVERQHKNTLTKSTPNIYRLATREAVAYQLQTALGYTTTIDLPEDARKVFVGDAELFKVEVYGMQVIIKPATDSPAARTNLTIYTASQRLSFDVTVGPPETADFILDFHYPAPEAQVQNEFKAQIDEKKKELEGEYQEKKAKQDQEVKKLTQEEFQAQIKKGAASKVLKMSRKEGGIQINLLSLTEIGDKSYIRFSVLNYSDHDYSIDRIVLGKETMVRRGFNLSKEGFAAVEFEENMEHAIPKETHHYGLLAFNKVSLRENERFALRIYEKDNPQPVEVTDIPVEAK